MLAFSMGMIPLSWVIKPVKHAPENLQCNLASVDREWHCLSVGIHSYDPGTIPTHVMVVVAKETWDDSKTCSLYGGGQGTLW